MKLYEITKNKGTYAGMKFSDNTINNINGLYDKFDIPNKVPDDKIHTTLLYSRKYLPNYEPLGNFDSPIIGTPNKCELWPTESEPSKNVLVMTYDCPCQVDRHNGLMGEHGGTWDYPDYTPHTTLSYDVGEDFDIDSINDYIAKDPFDIEIENEYYEDLDLDWSENNIK